MGTEITDKIKRFEEIAKRMLEVYKEKNTNYGDSFSKSLDEDGLLASKVMLGHKMMRFGSLVKMGSSGTADESIRDTLLDMANYAIMTMIWIEDLNNKR